MYKICGINKIVDINHSQNNISDDDKFVFTVEINGRSQMFAVGSGVKYTLIRKSQYENLNIKTQLQPSLVAFRSYTKDTEMPYGKVKVNVKYNNRQ